MDSFDEEAQKLGFIDAHEMMKMVANIDLSTPDKLREFQRWKTEDGTKEGLSFLLNREVI